MTDTLDEKIDALLGEAVDLIAPFINDITKKLLDEGKLEGIPPREIARVLFAALTAIAADCIYAGSTTTQGYLEEAMTAMRTESKGAMMTVKERLYVLNQGINYPTTQTTLDSLARKACKCPSCEAKREGKDPTTELLQRLFGDKVTIISVDGEETKH